MTTEGKAQEGNTWAIWQAVCGGLFGLVLGVISAMKGDFNFIAGFGIVIVWILGTLGALMVFVAKRGDLPNKGWSMAVTALVLVTLAVIFGGSGFLAVVGPPVMVVAAWSDVWFARNRVTTTR